MSRKRRACLGLLDFPVNCGGRLNHIPYGHSGLWGETMLVK